MPAGIISHIFANNSALNPPPIKTASGRSSLFKASMISDSITSIQSTPNFAAFKFIFSALIEFFSTAVAFIEGPESNHSIAIEPEPEPKSQRCWPFWGARADKVSALTGCFVICPSFANQSSIRPDACDNIFPGPKTFIPTIRGC